MRNDVIRRMISETTLQKNTSVNPLSSLFENQVIFRAWMKYSKQHIEHEERVEELKTRKQRSQKAPYISIVRD